MRKGTNGNKFENNPSKRGLCVICNKAKQSSCGTRKDGSKIWRLFCNHCIELHRGYERDRFRGSKDYRKKVRCKCERCGFIPEHISQLDVDHIDNNHDNNNPSNLQTLCANCHRLKTHEAKSVETNKRIQLVEDYFNEKEEYEKFKPKLKRYRKTIDYMQYKLRLPENSTKEEIKKAFEDYVVEFKARIGEEEYNKRREAFIRTQKRSYLKKHRERRILNRGKNGKKK